ncbi:hypothetical protein PR003_g13494 [Phytophthora rubi]|uniref:Uncharacterized protein n=1 Tax=Phytophthora rubi TaxID=129364 RepID=A0A6A4F6F8_9STRA|nr:hypothetical protein PR003_g13494 [Phytophthora rubi]
MFDADVRSGGGLRTTVVSGRKPLAKTEELCTTALR